MSGLRLIADVGTRFDRGFDFHRGLLFPLQRGGGEISGLLVGGALARGGRRATARGPGKLRLGLSILRGCSPFRDRL